MLHPEFPRAALRGAIAVLLVTLASAAAQANDAELVRKSVAVRITDLDPTRPADAQKLYTRIRRAAENACGDGLSAGAPIASPADRDCVRYAVADAVNALKQPLVAAIHQRDASLARNAPRGRTAPQANAS